ncbi:inositol 2-dehydrogenase [Thermus scotoductus]|uniref:Inositol 2-dehydrogenase n=1 Tax=Thermus scotoductus TaxID=37636 RepID=A0A430QWC2_THESC|nr:inositol 2-dehydrogenase [Thermus scotoductus]RTG99372.1 inositol 2-dehydrogenase [Thermus scotoductus]RTH21303.1 inositol 2-dehydrogenase [Thermus scotoductus]RTI33975.1 inositol 2-dehydrogenase [Thermus scotoductus]
MKRLGLALLGAGRMGQVHAECLGGIAEARVVAVADPVREQAERAAFLARAERVFLDPLEAMEAPGVEGVVIVTPTPTHAPLIREAARRKKAIFCEKPVALDLPSTQEALEEVRTQGVPFQIGFQRRFDPGYAQAKALLEEGALGQVDQFRAVGRDPFPPPLAYLATSGGIFLDMGVHDLDLARFLVGEVEEVFAWGTVRVDPEIGALGDVDTATLVLRFRNGALGVVENSRRAVYGYDIRTEVFGEKGKLVVEALPKTPLWRFGPGEEVRLDHFHFFTDRFREGYRLELLAFVRGVLQGVPLSPGPEDALESLRLALAATLSLREGRPVRVEEVR